MGLEITQSSPVRTDEQPLSSLVPLNPGEVRPGHMVLSFGSTIELVRMGQPAG